MRYLFFTVNLFMNGKHGIVDQCGDGSPAGAIRTSVGIFSFLPIKSDGHSGVHAQVTCTHAHGSALQQTTRLLIHFLQNDPTTTTTTRPPTPSEPAGSMEPYARQSLPFECLLLLQLKQLAVLTKPPIVTHFIVGFSFCSQDYLDLLPKHSGSSVNVEFSPIY